MIKWWTESNAKNPNSQSGMYLGIYVMLGFIGLGFMIIGLW